MAIVRRTPQACFVIFAAMILSTPLAEGDIIDDILDTATQASSRAAAARDRATEARDEAIAAKNNAIAAKNNTIEMVDNMHDGVQNLTGEMRSRIQEAVDDITQAIQRELAGAAEFINGPNSCSQTCVRFRTNQVTLLGNLAASSNAILKVSEINREINLDDEIDFIESLSGKALYPVYRVVDLAGGVVDEELIARLGEAADALLQVKDFLVGGNGNTAIEFDSCQLLVEHPELVENVVRAIRASKPTGVALETVGSRLSSIGKTKIAGRVGIWGWAGVQYTGALTERLGGHLKDAGERLKDISEILAHKLDYCTLKINQERIMTAVEANQKEVENITMAVEAIHEELVRNQNEMKTNQEQIMMVVEANHKEDVQHHNEILAAIKAIQFPPGRRGQP